MKALEELLEDGVRSGAFPAAEACVLSHGAERFCGSAGAVEAQSEFDLASLTKVLATTSLFAALWAEGKLTPERSIAHYFPESPAGRWGVTLEDLLTHRSGLPAWKPFFAEVLERHPALLADAAPAERFEARAEVVAAAAATELEAPLRKQAVYSDVGFILLGEAMSREANVPLDFLFQTYVTQRLELPLHFHRLSRPDPAHRAHALVTGQTRPRPPAPGQEGTWTTSNPSAPGEVDDDNAWVMDGVAGHAGLFGRAAAVARFGEQVLEDLRGAERLAPADIWKRILARDTVVPESPRRMGFDAPSGARPSSGQHFSPDTFGHLGFTGTSLWVDPQASLVVALCTNRTATGRDNVAIRDFRPRFHDAVVKALAE